MNENWKDIVGYEGIYQVSTIGRLKSIDRIVVTKAQIRKPIKGRILKQSLGTTGYYGCNLSKGAITKTKMIHRIVANTFIQNIDNKKEVNHINGIKTNNHILNLEWVTPKQNCQHAKHELKVNVYKEGFENNRSKLVVQVSLDGFIQNVFGSVNEAARKTGLRATHISECSNLKRKQVGGFYWR
jgi:hypothetical protein